ncbi:MAG: cell wall hydrolase [Candidatus Melainabacteria bacterium]|nr:cell wall hydrolase [Candidatus Melainabacteria bacterium]
MVFIGLFRALGLTSNPTLINSTTTLPLSPEPPRMTLEEALSGVQPSTPRTPAVSSAPDRYDGRPDSAGNTPNNFTNLSAAALDSYPVEYFTRPESRALELTTAERDLLGRLVYAEARGESLEGKAAVANSILNRWLSVKEGLSPGTFNARGHELADIIYAKNQYQPVREGKLNLPLNPAARESVDTAIDLALNPEQFRQKLAQVGKTPSEINRIMAATGFRAHYAFNDSSQNVNTAKLGGHLFNTAGNREMRSLVFERAGKKNSISTSPTETWLSNGAFTDYSLALPTELDFAK